MKTLPKHQRVGDDVLVLKVQVDFCLNKIEGDRRAFYAAKKESAISWKARSYSFFHTCGHIGLIRLPWLAQPVCLQHIKGVSNGSARTPNSFLCVLTGRPECHFHQRAKSAGFSGFGISLDSPKEEKS